CGHEVSESPFPRLREARLLVRPAFFINPVGNIPRFGASNQCDASMSSDSDFEELVTRYYQPLYQFAYSLTRTEADASDLTQQTFYIWAAKGHQLLDRAKVKTW